MTHYSEGSAAINGLVNCTECGLVAKKELTVCPRCNARLSPRRIYSLQVTLALLITAFVLYIPANLLPMMVTEKLGQVEYNTILGGIIVLWEEGSEPIAVVVFVASVLVPVLKFIILFMLLCHSARRCISKNTCQSISVNRIYWPMVDGRYICCRRVSGADSIGSFAQRSAR